MKAHFAHGWAFGPDMWEPLAACLPELDHSFADYGYYGGQNIPVPTEPAVWITHSLGTMLTLALPPSRCAALVAINGFDRFAAAPGVPGVPRRVVERMEARLAQDPAAVVADFRARCGAGPAPGEPCAQELQTGLRQLRLFDLREEAGALTVPVLTLQGDRDPILPRDMRANTLRGAAKARHRVHPEGGHLLPLSHPQWCADQIRTFIAGAL